MPSPADIHNGVDDDDNDVGADDNDMRLPMQLPLTLRRRCLQRRELRGGGGGLSVGLGLGADDNDDDVDDDNNDTRLPMQLRRERSLSRTIETRGGGGGRGGGIAVMLPPPSTDTRACNVGVEYVSFF